MNAVLGSCGILFAFVCALAGIASLGTCLYRMRRGKTGATVMGWGLGATGRLYGGGVLLGAVLATFSMERALIGHDYSIVYVAQNGSRETPLLYTITGMWSSLAGSILLWGLILAGYIVAVTWVYARRGDDALVGWAVLVTLVVAAFFLGLMLGPANPFTTVHGAVPHDGQGPNPLLQNYPLVAFHPPILYAGLVGFTVPFAFAVAALVTGRVGEGWSSQMRRWTLVAWGCLGAGIVLGAWWSYQVLGWGGFWAWDPVENAAFVPWLVGTAYLHSIVIEERRGLLRVWNMSLVSATFCLTILATFLTRSGVLESVHAFSNSGIGPLLIGFFGVAVVASLVLIAWRGDMLRTSTRVEAGLSREASFLANNLVFVGFAFVVLLGTVFPLFVEAVSSSQVSVGPPFFNTMSAPLVLALLFLMAVAPVLPWRRTTAERAGRRLALPGWSAAAVLIACAVGGVRGVMPLTAYFLGTFAGVSALRQLWVEISGARGAGFRRAFALAGRTGGGMVVHLGIVVLALGMASSLSFGHRTEVTLAPGATAVVAGHTVTYRSVATRTYPNRTAIVATVKVDGKRALSPALSTYPSDPQPIGTPGVDSGFVDDTYVTLDRAPSGPIGAVTLGVIVQPMVSWLWVGGAIAGVGTALALAAPSRRRRSTPPSAADDAPGDQEGHQDADLVEVSS